MRKKFGMKLILFSLAVLAGCNMPKGGEPADPTILPTHELNPPATMIPQVHGIETQEPTIVLVPTATETEEPTPQPADPQEIKFLPNGTIFYVQGEINAGQQISYTFGATGGQTLLAGVSSNDQAAYFEIRSIEDGSVLVSFPERKSSLSSLLPVLGNYQITLTADIDTVYFLTVEIPAELSILAGSGPQVVNGRLEVLEEFHPNVMTRVRYILSLEAGTTLNVQLQSDPLENLSLALTGVDDGVPYLRYVVESDAIKDFPVMVTQDYYLDVYSISGDTVDYSLEMEVY